MQEALCSKFKKVVKKVTRKVIRNEYIDFC